jgi:hypothetical protein
MKITLYTILGIKQAIGENKVEIEFPQESTIEDFLAYMQIEPTCKSHGQWPDNSVPSGDEHAFKGRRRGTDPATCFRRIRQNIRRIKQNIRRIERTMRTIQRKWIYPC